MIAQADAACTGDVKFAVAVLAVWVTALTLAMLFHWSHHDEEPTP